MARSTLEKLRTLEKLCEAGYTDEVLDRSLEKLVGYHCAQLEAHLQELEKDLREFEVRYRMSSAEFLARFQKGELGDAEEFVEWNALQKMHAQLRHQVSLLQESEGGMDPHGLPGRGEGPVGQ